MGIITIEDYLFEKIDLIKGDIEDSIVPLHNYGDPYVPFIGSALYIAIGNNQFLITANHIIGSLSTKISIPKQTEPQNFSFIGDSSIEKDFSFTKLEKPLEIFKPINVNNLMLKNKNTSSLFLAVGYPETKVEQYHKTIKTTLEIFITNECGKEDYILSKAKSIYNIVTRFIPKEIKKKGNKDTQLPFPNGMSGGGLFKISDQILFRDTKPELVGLLTRWDVENKKNMISTKIEYILAGIKHVYPDIELENDIVNSIKVNN